MQTNFHENDFALCIFRIGGGEIACSLRQFMISKVISQKGKVRLMITKVKRMLLRPKMN